MSERVLSSDPSDVVSGLASPPVSRDHANPCPHGTEEQRGKVVRCRVVGLAVAGPAASRPVCDVCRSQWQGGRPPDPSALTPILDTIRQRHGKFDDVVTSRAAQSVGARQQGVLSAPARRMKRRVDAAVWLIARTLRFAAAVARWLWRGAPTPEGKALARRRDQCDRCPARVWRLGIAVCLDCGCAVWLKQRMATESCPRRRWPGKSRCGPCGAGRPGGPNIREAT